MVNLESLKQIASPEFIRNGIAESPYCSANEKLYLGYLSEAAVGDRPLRVGYSLVTAGNIPVPKGIARTIPLPGRYFTYDTHSALAISSTNPAIEGMILGYNIGGVRHANRHYFSQLERPGTTRTGRKLEEVLPSNLERLGIQIPDKDHDAIETLMALIAINNLKVGKHFESNIRTFTAWFKSAHPRPAKYYW